MNKIDRNMRRLKNELEALRDKEPEEDTGMFTKKMLAAQTNCASCSKNIKDLLTGPVEHSNWNRLPFRQPNENIARYGQGFSKILKQIQPSEAEAQMLRADHGSAMAMEASRSRNNLTVQEGHASEGEHLGPLQKK